MLKHLKLSNVGPAAAMELEFGARLNLITGDNGLGKSFLLDIAWWALTRKWPSEVNPRLTSGSKALPRGEGKAIIDFAFTGKSKVKDYVSEYQRREQLWAGPSGRPANPGLVFYAMSDGSFALWDPARNYWRTLKGEDVQERQPAYVFSPAEVWDGLRGEEGNWLCNGLIRDWASWQKEKGQAFEHLCSVLKVLSPSEREPLSPGELTRISLDDVRDMPTVRMPYGQDVPVLHASSGMRRIMALTYFVVWAWEEHLKAAKLLDEEPATQAIFLIDEMESHLHPQWQRRIVPALLTVMQQLNSSAQIQLIAATHSPLVMASLEPLFEAEQDAWFDLDFEQSRVVLTRREFTRHGDASSWLTSEAFDLKEPLSVQAEEARLLARDLLREVASKQQSLSAEQHQRLMEIDMKLRACLSDVDPFWIRWSQFREQKAGQS